ncbi:MAG: futalosine hydrolase, partial [Bacteroidota bacterium]
YLETHYDALAKHSFQKGDLQVDVLLTGVGMTATAFALGQYLATAQPSLLLNAGTAGAFDRDIPLGTVLNVVSERFADLGVETATGSFTDVHELGLVGADDFPFQQGLLQNEAGKQYAFLPQVSGLTVNKVHGFPQSIERLQTKYAVAVETMEGAAVFYACLLAKVPFLQIRSISNYVEARNKANWKIPLAIERLNQVLLEMLQTFE